MDGPSTDVDETLTVLRSSNRRQVLEYLADESVESATVEELAFHLATAKSDREASETRDRDTLEMRLHHVHLPKLDDHGVLEFDARSNTARYRSNARVEELLACIPDAR